MGDILGGIALRAIRQGDDDLAISDMTVLVIYAVGIGGLIAISSR